MSWSTYLGFAAFAAVVVVAPGPDFAMVVKNTIAGGRRGGLMTGLGVGSSCIVQGAAAALGIGTVIAGSEPVFLGLRWAGVAYLCWLAGQMLRASLNRRSAAERTAQPVPRSMPPRKAFAQGFLCNITNPKMLAFYLSVLPQFLVHGRATSDGLLLASTHAVLGVLWLGALTLALHRVGPWLAGRRVQRALDAATGSALLGFASVLAVEAG